MKRRGVLAWVGAGVSGVLGGCGSAVSSDRSHSNSTSPATVEVRTPAVGECEPTGRLRPKPESDRTKRYPAHPESVTASTARSFARSFERAYRFNSLLPEYDTIGVSVDVPDWTVASTGDGYRLGVEGRVSFGDGDTPGGTSDATSPGESPGATPSPTPTARPSGTFGVSVWYYVTDRFALRGEPVDELQQGDGPDLSGAEIATCDRSGN